MTPASVPSANDGKEAHTPAQSYLPDRVKRCGAGPLQASSPGHSLSTAPKAAEDNFKDRRLVTSPSLTQTTMAEAASSSASGWNDYNSSTFQRPDFANNSLGQSMFMSRCNSGSLKATLLELGADVPETIAVKIGKDYNGMKPMERLLKEEGCWTTYTGAEDENFDRTGQPNQHSRYRHISYHCNCRRSY